MVAGEKSGDLLGADLIRNLKKIYPNALFEGVGGPSMISEGFQSYIDMDRLSVMGIMEPLKRLPELLRHQKSIIKRYSQNPPAVFVGIDSPDFNLKIERILKSKSIKTVHYVSPSVWAWRQGRVKKIKASVDLMLTLFPFENEIYEKNNIPVKNVGHPLASQLVNSRLSSRKRLDLSNKNEISLCVMPGSRAEEVSQLLIIFLEAIDKFIIKNNIELKIAIPAANQSRYKQISEICADHGNHDIKLTLGDSHKVMRESDLVLLASGTSSIEAMLLLKPMIVVYKLHWLTFSVAKPLIKTKFVALPNLLSQKMLVPELLQENANSESILFELEQLVFHTDLVAIQNKFKRLSQSLMQNSGKISAGAVSELIEASNL